MIVVVRGDPMKIGTSLCGLDILSPRHPMLFSLIVSRMGMQSSTSDQVGGYFYIDKIVLI